MIQKRHKNQMRRHTKGQKNEAKWSDENWLIVEKVNIHVNKQLKILYLNDFFPREWHLNTWKEKKS